MTNVANKLQMTDGTICDIFEWALDMGGINMSRLNTRFNVFNLRTRINDITSNFSTVSERNRPIFLHNMRNYPRSGQGTPIYNYPVSATVHYNVDDPNNEYPEVYIYTAGYVIEVYHNSDVIIYKNITTEVTDVSVTAGEVVTADKLSKIINALTNGKTLTYFATSNYFNHTINKYMITPTSSAPVAGTISDFFTQGITGNLVLVYVYYTGTTLTEKSITITHSSTGYSILVSS